MDVRLMFGPKAGRPELRSARFCLPHVGQDFLRESFDILGARREVAKAQAEPGILEVC
jgi:hypothetical protein